MSRVLKVKLVLFVFISIPFLIGNFLLGYSIYCSLFSGSTVGEFTIFEKSFKSFAFDRLKANKANNGNWFTPLRVNLSPDMNPVAFTINSVIVRPTSTFPKEASYEARLTLKDKLVWVDQIKFIGVKRKSRNKRGKNNVVLGDAVIHYQPIKTFSLTEAGDYEFDAKRKGGNLIVTRLNLTVRKNVTTPRKDFVRLGLLMFAIGAIGITGISFHQVLKPQKTE